MCYYIVVQQKGSKGGGQIPHRKGVRLMITYEAMMLVVAVTSVTVTIIFGALGVIIAITKK